MAEPNPRFDRVRAPDAAGRSRRDVQGKEALYSTAPGAPPSAHVLVVCPRCDVETGLRYLQVVKLLKPPVVYNPVTRRLWAKCPTCEQRAWLSVRPGQALRALLGRDETARA